MSVINLSAAQNLHAGLQFVVAVYIGLNQFVSIYLTIGKYNAKLPLFRNYEPFHTSVIKIR